MPVHDDDDHEHVVPRCAKCGRYHERRTNGGNYHATCTAHKQSGEPCPNWPGVGMAVCKQTHGGRSRQAKEAAARRLERQRLEARAAAALATVNPDPKYGDPIQGLMWEVAMSASAVMWWAARVAELSTPDPNDPDGIMRAMMGQDRMGRFQFQPSISDLWGPDHEGDGAIHVVVDMWNQERDRHARLCERAVKAGVAAEMLTIASNTAEIIVQVVNYALENIGLADAATRQRARQLVAEKMRQIGPAMSKATT